MSCLRFIKGAVIGAGLVLASAGMASASTWYLNGSHPGPNTGNPLGNTNMQFTSAGVTATVTGWTRLNDGPTFGEAAVNQYGNLGLGVCNSNEFPACTSPNHAIDNQGSIDFALVDFGGNTVKVSSLYVSSFFYNGSYTDTDLIYVLGSGTLNINGMSYSDLVNNPNYTVVSSNAGPGSRFVNVGNVNAQWLLVGAAVNNPDKSYDYFKLKKVIGTVTTVPEPTTWSLMIVAFGMLGSFAYRRRRLAA